MKSEPLLYREMPRLTAVRAHRLGLGVPLVNAAVFAGLPLARASEIERYPEAARPGELDQLRAGVERAASEHKKSLASMAVGDSR